jgi:hypothetical protein
MPIAEGREHFRKCVQRLGILRAAICPACDNIFHLPEDPIAHFVSPPVWKPRRLGLLLSRRRIVLSTGPEPEQPILFNEMVRKHVIGA